MRKLWIALVPAVVLSVVGCGGKSNKPVDPANLTPEQIEADVKNQKEASAAEGKRQAGLPKTGQAGAEDSERQRQNGR